MWYTLNIHCIGALSVRSFVRLSVSQSFGLSIGPSAGPSAGPSSGHLSGHSSSHSSSHSFSHSSSHSSGWMHRCLPVRLVNKEFCPAVHRFCFQLYVYWLSVQGLQLQLWDKEPLLQPNQSLYWVSEAISLFPRAWRFLGSIGVLSRWFYNHFLDISLTT